MTPSPPNNLSDDEKALWNEQGGCTPRQALCRLSYERWELQEARQEITRLRARLMEAREWLEHEDGHPEGCSGCAVEEDILDVIRGWEDGTPVPELARWRS